jgi:rare lipoprotein A
MASGENFDPQALTAAHRSLALGSRVRVTNLENNQTVTVTVTDRGPFVRGRIIDLSLAAAHALGMIEKGVTRVRVEALPAISPAS